MRKMKIAPNSPCLVHSNQYLLGGMWGVVGSEGSGVEQTRIMVLTTACVIKRAQIMAKWFLQGFASGLQPAMHTESPGEL